MINLIVQEGEISLDIDTVYILSVMDIINQADCMGYWAEKCPTQPYL